MKSKPCLFGIVLLASAIAVNERVDASGRKVETEQQVSDASSPSSTLVERVREATEAFRHTIPDAYQQFLGCVSGPEQGAMGVHFVNFALVDGKPEVKAPEALIDEVKDGRVRLVGVEYIVPVDALASRGRRAAGAGVGRPGVPLQREPEPVRSSGVLRAPRLGVA
jgi:hypothetical protein